MGSAEGQTDVCVCVWACVYIHCMYIYVCVCVCSFRYNVCFFHSHGFKTLATEQLWSLGDDVTHAAFPQSAEWLPVENIR